ncbi:hypothetical protein J8I26_21340 [Herbaspirillum sp. LeCh32-8]|uniref:hypothetical protein n=1 Tax=Herbaspirillum sp. LeCh32-8 TaxID=2821356 RepID=UPI001AE20BAB|nr:hypothetical protein [Herbaspirillum sp. LeCh32-8]MBP0600672.1 hypothetical protein [Herbaspirillum sp. LeCh32-8]
MTLTFPSWRQTLCVAMFSLGIAAALPAAATPLVDLLAGDVLPMTGQLKKDLQLTPNQQTLWRQTEQKTRAILGQRQQRRARLQEDTEQLMRTPGAELRDLARGYDDDGAAAEQEARQLREIWFSMADALDDHQRKLVQDYIADRMQRATDGPGRSEGGRSGGRGSPPSGGMGAGMGGMGGMGTNRSSSGSFGSDSGF